MAESIKAENISKRYRLGTSNRPDLLRSALAELVRRPRPDARAGETIWALREVSFSVDEGEIVGIVGRNGAGKSTLLKVLSRITVPTAGSMRTKGRVASLLEVGTGFHEELTGRENVYLNGSILGMKKREIDAKLDEIVAFAEVASFLDTPIKRYSTGMRLRLGFAVAAHIEPDILMVDEILAVGDIGFQKKCLSAMGRLHSGGRTVLFVSHNLSAVEHLCPRTLWIDQGRLRGDGETRAVIQEYLETFAATRRGAADLAHAERHGSGDIQYTRLELLDDSGRPMTVVRSGAEVTIRLHYHAAKRVQQPHFGVEILTSLGTLITSINTWTSGFNLEAIPCGEGWIDVHLESLNLVPDRYYLTLWIARVGLKFDHLNLCVTVDVEAADVYRAGRALDGRFGILFFPCAWRCSDLTTRAAPDHGPSS